MKKFFLGFAAASLIFLAGISIYIFLQTRAAALLSSSTKDSLVVYVDEKGDIQLDGEKITTVFELSPLLEKLSQVIAERKRAHNNLHEERVTIKCAAALKSEVCIKVFDAIAGSNFDITIVREGHR